MRTYRKTHVVFSNFNKEDLVKQNLGHTFINTNKVYGNLIIANPLRKEICKTLVSTTEK